MHRMFVGGNICSQSVRDCPLVDQVLQQIQSYHVTLNATTI
jgi:hypothetical protein